MKTKIVLVLGVAVVAVSAAILISRSGGTGTDLPKESAGPAGAVPAIAEKSTVRGENPAKAEDAAAEAERKAFDPTAQPAGAPAGKAGEGFVKVAGNPHARSVAEALVKKEHPERLSALISPKPFDKAAFEADPLGYCQVIEPGRVQLCMQPGPGVPALRATGAHQFRAQPEGEVKLEVKAAAKSPVTFTSFDAGTFAESKLNSVTVQADDNGLAHATFVATSGADGDVNILAGCPLTSGQVRFVVMVDSPALRRPAIESAQAKE